MNLGKAWKELIDFREERGWGKYHTDAELARALMIEAAELNRLFIWGMKQGNEKLQEEIADTMIYCIYLCINNGFNPEEIILNKIKKNAEKYPATKKHEW